MGKKSRRQRVNAASRRGATGRFDESTQPKLTVAEAEAELRAAMAAVPPSNGKVVKVSEHPRCARAIVALSAAVTVDDDDQTEFSKYFEIITTALERRENVETNELIKAIKRWPRIRKYWRRIRRRMCWGCGKEYDLSEPRLWVCGGCRGGRYWDEGCQSAHWPAHKTPCLKTFHEKTKKSLSRGVSVEKLRQAYLEAYHDDGAARVFSAMDKK